MTRSAFAKCLSPYEELCIESDSRKIGGRGGRQYLAILQDDLFATQVLAVFGRAHAADYQVAPPTSVFFFLVLILSEPYAFSGTEDSRSGDQCTQKAQHHLGQLPTHGGFSDILSALPSCH